MASTLPATTAERTRPDVRAPQAPAGLTATDLLLLLMASIWGANYIVVKFATGVMAPLAFNSARIVLATVVLFAIAALGRRALPRGRDFYVLLALGVLGNGIYQILFVEGVARTRAGDAALLLAGAPALMAIIGFLRGVERVGARGVAGILLSLAGIGLVTFGSPHGGVGDSTLLGNALVLGACFCWSLYSVLVKPYTERFDGISLSAVTMLGGAVPMLLVSAPKLAATPWSSLGLAGWTAVAYSGLLALVVAYLCWYRGVRVLGPTRAGMYANLQPIIALGVAWAFLAEAPRATQLAGAACIMGGLLLTRLTGASSRAFAE